MKNGVQRACPSYVFSVSVGAGCYRHIQISGDRTLLDLSDAILDAFSFLDDHMHAFFMDNRAWSDADAYYSQASEPGQRVSSRARLSKLGLRVGSVFKYVFDFGDDWRFQCKVLKVLDEKTDAPRLLRSVGAAPLQYGEDFDGEADGADFDGGGFGESCDAETDGVETCDVESCDVESCDVESCAVEPNGVETGAVESGGERRDASGQARAILPDALYDLAFRFKKAKLWKKLSDTELFAVRYPDGMIGYCCVMGLLGEHFALALYLGDEGMASYRSIARGREDMSESEKREMIVSEDCVMLSFVNRDDLRPMALEEVRAYCEPRGLALRGKNAFPEFLRFRPNYFRWYVRDETDQARLLTALEAALDVSAKLLRTSPEAAGFTDGAPFGREIPLLEKKDGGFVWGRVDLPEPMPVSYPALAPLDDFTLARLVKARKNGLKWGCDILTLLDPSVREGAAMDGAEPIEAPHFPCMLLIVNTANGEALLAQLAESPVNYAESFARAVLALALRQGSPEAILTCNERTHAFFDGFAKQTNANLALQKDVPFLNDVERAFIERIEHKDEHEEQDIEELMELLRTKGALEQMPDEILSYLLRCANDGILPDDVVLNLTQECAKRGIE